MFWHKRAKGIAQNVKSLCNDVTAQTLNYQFSALATDAVETLDVQDTFFVSFSKDALKIACER